MSANLVIEQLLQQALDSDRTPEEVCADHPELLWDVRQQWQSCRKLDAELEALFPSSHGPREAERRPPLQLSDKLPILPGYEVESILGRGGMGVVYKAKQLKLNRPVALKMLLAGNFAAKPEILRFMREAEAIAALRHSNVVQIYDIGDFESRPYFTMDNIIRLLATLMERQLALWQVELEPLPRRPVMERELWNSLYQLACKLDNSWKQGRHLTYDAAVIVGVYLWAVIHDRPTSWACDPKNWVGVTPPDPLPSQPRMSVRLRSKNVQALLDAIDREMVAACQAAAVWLMMIDTKPLPVGAYSKDRHARLGFVARGRWARGYKLHVIWGLGAYPRAWEVTGLNESDMTVAKQLIPRVHQEGYLLGDRVFDSNDLFDAAGALGLQLVSPKRRPGRFGHRRHSPYRLRAQDLLNSKFGEALYEERDQIERHLGQLTSFGGGLAPLPNWVRQPHRVRTWVHAKLILNARRTQLRQENAMQAAA